MYLYFLVAYNDLNFFLGEYLVVIMIARGLISLWLVN